MGRLVENKRKKKKGRPSLLDLQKRSLRLQKKNPNPNPNKPPPNPYLRFPQSTSRRSSRGDQNPDGQSDELEEEGTEEGSGFKRKEKKLELVLRIPPDQPRFDSSASGSDGDGTRKRPIGDVAGAKMGKRAGDSDRGQRFDLEVNTTPLPDKKLLLFILERLQKKDTYGVFSEPVDPEELPDYHDIIDHPMDFGTIRKKLSGGVYVNLEQFENDVFLIASNAMRYNASDTVYFRQARSIQELAKKDFQNLRQESDEDEPEQKTARRGRPPTKAVFKKPVGRPFSERITSNVSGATLANAPDNAHWSRSSINTMKTSLPLEKPSLTDLTSKSFQLSQTSEYHGWLTDKKSEENEGPSGSLVRGRLYRYGKKVVVSEENRRNTYNHHTLTNYELEAPILTTFDGEKKELVPVGLHIGYAYARSLARFAASLGPVAWECVAKRIEMALPPETKFGRGWVDEQDAPRIQQPPVQIPSSSVPCQTASPIMVPWSTDNTNLSGDLSNSSADKNLPGRSAHSPSAEPFLSGKCSTPPGIIVVSESSGISAHDEMAEAARGCTRAKVLEFPVQTRENPLIESRVKASFAGSGSNLPLIPPLTEPAMHAARFATDVSVSQNQVPEVGFIKGTSATQSTLIDQTEVHKTKFGSPCIVNSFSSFFHPPCSSGQAVVQAELQNLGGSADSINTTSKSHAGTDRTPPCNSDSLGSRSSFPRLATGPFDMERSKNHTMMNNIDRISHSSSVTVSPSETERLKVLPANPGNHGKNSAHPMATGHPVMVRRETSNNATNSGNISHTSPLSRVEVEKSKLGSPSNVGANGIFSDSAATTNADIDKMRSGNSSKVNFYKASPELRRDLVRSGMQLSVHQKLDSTPDLNVRFQSPTSPPPGVAVDSQQPDLVLQL